jgi:hypothetical protein
VRVLAIAVLLVPALVSAGIDEKGIRIGLGTFPINQEHPETTGGGSAPSPRPGPSSVSLGSYVTLRVSSLFAFQFEAVFASKNSQSEQCVGGTGDSSSCVDVSNLYAYYVELPLLIRFDWLHGERTKFHVDFGGELAIHLGNVEKLSDQPAVKFKPANGGEVLGLGFQFGAGPGRITLDARYKRWLAPLKDADLASNMSHIDSGNQFSLEVGYAFP